MERSMIHELTGSNIFMGRSFITTATQHSNSTSNLNSYTQPYDLKKSRIYNLPNYKKQDLSGKQNFVLVFQAIQIQRLSLQIQTLRVKLKEAQRQIFNYNNYEVQIRQLTQKCICYERQRQEYRQQIQKLNTICQRLYDQLEEMKRRYSQVDLTLKQKYKLQKTRNDQLYQQLQKWKRKFSSLELSKNKEIQDIKQMVQSQRKSMIDRELRQLTVKFQAQRNNLQNQIRKLRGSLDNKNNQIFRVQSQMTRMEITIKELQRNQEQLNEYENKVVMLSQEMMRLNELLRIRQEQIDRLRSSSNKLQATLAQSQKNTQNYNQLIIRQKQLEVHIEKIGTQFARLQQENRRNNLQAQKVGQYQRLLDDSANQIQRLNQIVRDKIHQVQSYKQQYTNIQIHIQQLQNKEQKIPQLENKINILLGENERIDSVLKSRTKEMEEWRNKSNTHQRNVQNYKLIQKERANLQNQMNNKIRIIQEKTIIIQRLQGQLAKIDELSHLLNQNQNKARELSKEVDRLNIVIRNKSKECQDLSQVVHNKDRELINLHDVEQQLAQYRKKQAYFTQQLDRINGVINQKCQEISNLKEQFKKIGAHMQDYQKLENVIMENAKQIQQLLIQLDQSRRQTEFFQTKTLQTEGQVKRLQNQIFASNREKQSIVYMLQQKDREIQQFNIELRERQQQIHKMRQLQGRFVKLNGQYNQLQNKYRNQSTLLQNITKEMEKIKNQGAYSRQFVLEFMNLRKQAQQKNVQLQNLLFRIQNVENILRALRGACQNQMKKQRTNHQKWLSTANALNYLTQFLKKTISLQGQITKLAQQNILLQSSTRLLNFQVQSANNLMSKSLVVSQFETTPQRHSSYTHQYQQQQHNENAFNMNNLQIPNNMNNNINSPNYQIDSYKRRMNVQTTQTKRYQF